MEAIMPTALRDWQAAFAAQLSGAPETGEKRLAIHRHHIASSLARVLATTFPTVQTLVGADFFRQAAQAFVTGELPTQPVLAEYGAGFPEFVETYAPAAGLPYLADMARLDWALNVAFHSPRRPCLSAADLSVVPPELLATSPMLLAPGTALVRSRYPIDLIWAASQPGASDEKQDIGRGPACVLVLRRPDDAGFLGLSLGEATFVAGLKEGQTVEKAAGAAFAADSAFNLSRSFGRLVVCEAFAAVQ
jgi:hypothetical protein